MSSGDLNVVTIQALLAPARESAPLVLWSAWWRSGDCQYRSPEDRLREWRRDYIASIERMGRAMQKIVKSFEQATEAMALFGTRYRTLAEKLGE